MTISDVTVSENSPFAIVRVSLSQAAAAAINFTPSLANGPASGGSGAGLVGTDVSGTIEYYNGTAWVSAAGGVTIPVGATGVLLRVAIINDTLEENSEIVTISTGPVTNVLNPEGLSTTITIRDDAGGNLFGGTNTSGTPDAPGTGGLPQQLDDDRPLAVGSVTVNESSPFAIFSVSGAPGQLVSLALSGGSATIGTDFQNVLQYFDGSIWVAYAPGSFVAIPPIAVSARSAAPMVQSAVSVLRVRVPIVQDSPFENSEQFTVQASTAGGQLVVASGFIVDNGTGDIFLPANTTGIPDAPGTPGVPATLDDDRPLLVTGTALDCHAPPFVTVIDPFTGLVRHQFPVFESKFRGGVRVAVGDVDGDGVHEVLVAPGAGRVGEIRVYEIDGTELVTYRTRPFGAAYRQGVEIAAGDVDGDGVDDIVAAASRGPGNVAVFRSRPAAADPVENRPYRAFAAFAASFRGGASVAVADLSSVPDGKGEIIVGSGAGMAPQVRVFDVTNRPRVVKSFAPAFGGKFRGGVSVSTAKFDGDSVPDIIVAAGMGGGSVVQIHDGRLDSKPGARLNGARLAAFAGFAGAQAAVFAAAMDTDGDGRADRIFASQGEGGEAVGVRSMSQSGVAINSPSPVKANVRLAVSKPRR